MRTELGARSRLDSSLLCLLCLCIGCARAARPEAMAGPQVAASGPLRFLPLEHDTVFSYETFLEDTNEHGLAVIEVTRPRPDLAELRVAGKVKKRYYIRTDGLEGAGGGYVLKAPLALNAKWRGEDGTVEVTQENLSIRVPAGAFSGCLQTIETASLPSGSRRTTTVYCPGVGITWLEIAAAAEGDSVTQRLELKSFGPRFVP